MLRKNQIAVIGSSNVDLIMKMDVLPEKGETVTNANFMQTFGGKGANQAVAAARAGANTLFVNAVGNDPYVEHMLSNFEADGIDTSCITRIDDVPSGHALVMIGEAGMNYLSVAPGANSKIKPFLLERYLDQIRDVPVWLLQCEIPEISLQYILDAAKTTNNRVLWNFAPAIDMENPPLDKCDILVVNEIEAEQLSGIEVSDDETAVLAADHLRTFGVKHVVITLGAEGLIYKGEEGTVRLDNYDVEVVDTTAAGDTFCGALACAIVDERNWEDALKFANAAANLCVTALGAQSSIPLRADIELFMRGK